MRWREQDSCLLAHEGGHAALVKVYRNIVREGVR
jgi:hypothetical protein